MTFPIIDSHQHVWDPVRAEYDWLTPELAPVDRAIDMDELLPELRAAGVDATVLVQSADNIDDTDLMRETAADHPEVVAIVAFAPLDDAEAVMRAAGEWASDPLIVGVRNLIHNNPDPDWLLRPEVDEGLGALETAGLAFDLVAVLPRHLELVPIISERHPDLRIVIDHLGKPPVGRESHEPWSTLIADAARNPLVFGKVSGLYAAAGDPADWTPEAVMPVVDRALEVFGPDRLMFGGDWPISILAGGYTRVWQGLSSVLSRLDDDARERVLGRTAVEFYRIDAARLGDLAR